MNNNISINGALSNEDLHLEAIDKPHISEASDP
jgi:hypothetical protein